MDKAPSPSDKRPAATANTPRKVSDLLTAFGASRSPTSATNLRKQMQSNLEPSKVPASHEDANQTSYAPPDAGARSTGATNGVDDSDSDDVIHGLSPVGFSMT